MNPSPLGRGLSLAINADDNSPDFELAVSVGKYFRLTPLDCHTIISEVRSAVSRWNTVAGKLGIRPAERERMAVAFKRVD